MANKSHSNRRSKGGDCGGSRPEQSSKPNKCGVWSQRPHNDDSLWSKSANPSGDIDFFHLYQAFNRSCEEVRVHLLKCGDLNLPLFLFGLELQGYGDKLEFFREKFCRMQPGKEKEAGQRLIAAAEAMIPQIAKFVAGLRDWQAVRRVA